MQGVRMLRGVGVALLKPRKAAAAASAPSATRLLAGHDGGNGDAVLTWSAPLTGPVTGYKLYRSLSSGTEALFATIGNVLTYDDTSPLDISGLAMNYYKVSAFNAAGEGQKSNEVSFTVTNGEG